MTVETGHLEGKQLEKYLQHQKLVQEAEDKQDAAAHRRGFGESLLMHPSVWLPGRGQHPGLREPKHRIRDTATVYGRSNAAGGDKFEQTASTVASISIGTPSSNSKWATALSGGQKRTYARPRYHDIKQSRPQTAPASPQKGLPSTTWAQKDPIRVQQIPPCPAPRHTGGARNKPFRIAESSWELERKGDMWSADPSIIRDARGVTPVSWLAPQKEWPSPALGGAGTRALGPRSPVPTRPSSCTQFYEHSAREMSYKRRDFVPGGMTSHGMLSNSVGFLDIPARTRMKIDYPRYQATTPERTRSHADTMSSLAISGQVLDGMKTIGHMSDTAK